MKKRKLPNQIAKVILRDPEEVMGLSEIDSLICKISTLTQVDTETIKESAQDLINLDAFMMGWTIGNLRNVFDLLSMAIPMGVAIELTKKGIDAHTISSAPH